MEKNNFNHLRFAKDTSRSNAIFLNKFCLKTFKCILYHIEFMDLLIHWPILIHVSLLNDMLICYLFNLHICIPENAIFLFNLNTQRRVHVLNIWSITSNILFDRLTEFGLICDCKRICSSTEWCCYENETMLFFFFFGSFVLYVFALISIDKKKSSNNVNKV